MSADNYYFVRKREDGRFGVSHRFASFTSARSRDILVCDKIADAVLAAHALVERDAEEGHPVEYGVVIKKGLIDKEAILALHGNHK